MTRSDNADYLDRLIERDALSEYLTATLGPADNLEFSYHPEGQSNETLFLQWDEYDLVLRRPPAGATADSAHDVLREYRVLEALRDAAVPVPQPIAGCDDHDIIGAEFYLMERCRGDVLRDEEPNRFAHPRSRRLLSERFIETIADIHETAPDAVGLGELGHPDGYTERQVDRWTEQLEWAFERTEEERSVPLLRDVADWLAENVPDEYDHTLVHGDYKLDNVMFAPGGGHDAPTNGRAGDAHEQSPAIEAVFDWELCTRGDPAMDLGWMLVYWPDPGDPAVEDSLLPQFLVREGYPTRRELVEQYEDRTGRTFDHHRFYRTFGVFKMASACEMMYRRYLDGNADNETYPLMEERVPRLADRADRIRTGEEPL
ncbi:phosphotransferase family protein [Natronorubrum daqingense]|uniref:Phosphotransferase family protein n=1 Tax=Natronorubrum daqingense TaxID=588898 RepID=A0A1N7D4C4_9EURY|nr:phosphotransferase family protein [Natronorubrum daqingense]APX97207.1 phosphotransferase family protein [Natronorubrum daqingense]SIR70736.1 Predicted kinase, aminoglycoside phosphotransferase (APT) family [Natronorubrum daqingense]